MRDYVPWMFERGAGMKKSVEIENSLLSRTVVGRMAASNLDELRVAARGNPARLRSIQVA